MLLVWSLSNIALGVSLANGEQREGEETGRPLPLGLQSMPTMRKMSPCLRSFSGFKNLEQEGSL